MWKRNRVGGRERDRGGRERKIETEKGLGVRESKVDREKKIKRETCWEKEAEPQRVRKK